MYYQKHYDELINRARDRYIEEYTERHHIIPLCIGGTDNEENLVDLIPEEHYIAHQLLVKLYPGNRKILWAVHRMSSNSYKNPRNHTLYGWIRRKVSAEMSGIRNHMSKLTAADVLDIYYSTERTDSLTEKYNVSASQILSVKKKKSYKSVLANVTDLPGVHPSIRRIPLSDETVRQIFLDEGGPTYFKEKYRIGIVVVRNIKTKKTYKSATKGLKKPGQIAYYGLFPHDVFAIKNSKKSEKQLAKIYDVTIETIYNIRNNRTRRFIDILY